MNALVSGATGLVGRRLVRNLEHCAVLGRDPAKVRSRLGEGVSMFAWSPEQGPPPAEAFADKAVVFHLAGEPVAEGRWSGGKKRRIRESRIAGTRNLVTALARLETRPRVLVAASAVGVYGDRGEEILTETSAAGTGYLAEVCAAWERESLRAAELGLRVVLARIGVVLAPEGGALARLLPTFRLGLGGPLGNGRQWLPWIHIDDVVGLLLHAARVEALHGPLNVVSPQPVTNRELSRSLGRLLRRPALLPVPGVVLRVAVGELAQVLLGSQRAHPEAAHRSGYRFAHTDLPSALADCVRAAPAT